MDVMIGTNLSHYRIVEEIGAGGMGVVYRAHDERLERDVALKVLPPEMLADAAARKRFRKEALSLSRLNHPNIGTVFDFDTQDGVDFIVMELIPGITLGERLRDGPLAESEVARLGDQLAEGLSAAHAQGVIHRDIKPANVRITPEGRVKLLDFGLAMAARLSSGTASTESVTVMGQVMGTVPYMSPEQLRGERVDARSDQFSLGAVLYEMATGQRSFPQESQPRVITAILSGTPLPPRQLRGELTPELERIVLKCLEKDRERRYGSAADLATDLKRLIQPDAAAVRRPVSRSVVRRVTIGVAAALAVAVGAALVALDVGGLRGLLFQRTAAGMIPSLAVLPLANLSGNPDEEYFADGMTDEIITRLAQVQALKVISRTSAMQYKGTKKGPRQIAKELGVRMLVEGTVLMSGDRVRISAALIEASTQRSVWAETLERNLADVFAVQSEIAGTVVERLRARLTPEERQRIAAVRRVNPEAYAEYLRGRRLVQSSNPVEQEKSIEHFQRAIDLDPSYAQAYVGLSLAYRATSSIAVAPREAMPRARAAALRALELDSTLSEARGAVGYVAAFYDWNWKEGEAELRGALARDPGDALMHSYLGYFLTTAGRFDEAMNEYTRAKELDPLSDWIAYQTLFPPYNARRYGETIAAARAMLKAEPNLLYANHPLAQALLMSGDAQTAVNTWKEMLRVDPGAYPARAWLAYGLGVLGHLEEARANVRELENQARSGFVGAYFMGIAYTGLGDKDRAFAWLEKGFEDRSEDMVFLNVEPGWDPLRSDPRFKGILRRMGFAS